VGLERTSRVGRYSVDGRRMVKSVAGPGILLLTRRFHRPGVAHNKRRSDLGLVKLHFAGSFRLGSELFRERFATFCSEIYEVLDEAVARVKQTAKRKR